MQLQLLQPLHDGRPLLPPLLVTTSPPSIPARPALAPWCRVVEDDARVLVEHGGTLVTLEGRAAGSLLPALLPLLDGTRTVDDVGAAVGERARPAVDRALELLAHHRLLVDGPLADNGDADASSAASYAASVTRRISPAGAVAALAGASVAVVGSGRQADEVARQLRLAGIGQVERPPGTTAGRPHLVVAAPPPDDTALLREVNRACLADGRAWLQLLPYDGRLIVVGPLFLPGSSACGTCFALRRAACSGYEDDVALLEPLPLRARAPTPLLAVAAGLAATVAVRWLTAADPSLPGHLHVVEGGHPLGVSSHRVLRVPRCPDCGPFEQAVPAPWFAETA